MGRKDTFASKRRGISRGFSTLEVLVSLGVILILGAMVSPQIVRTLRTYQLNDKATRLAGLVKLTRFEAIRMNTKVSLGLVQAGGQWTVWKDTIANGAPDATEVQEVFGEPADLLAAAPNPAPIAATVGTLNLSVKSGANGAIAFDARGAVDYGAGSPAVYVFYVGSATDPQVGYRAVVVLPSGATQVWTSTAAGDWRRTG
ncbi:MAG TPA: GspH/FimT family pseudopilin [Candidatus Dormibacteraeota bacterium]|nr:GspH/FimT family pseudopilin [Candidatus Dormibacteraeota bacterium]